MAISTAGFSGGVNFLPYNERVPFCQSSDMIVALSRHRKRNDLTAGSVQRRRYVPCNGFLPRRVQGFDYLELKGLLVRI